MNNIMSELIHACEENDLKTVRKLLREGVDINATDKYGNTALQYAVGGYNNDIAKELLKFEGIDVNIMNNSGYTVLMSSCNIDNIECFKELIKNKSIDYNIRRNDGYTALIFAVRWGRIEIIKELLKIDAIYIYDALNEARHFYQDEIVKMIKERIYRDISIIKMPHDITRLIVDYI